MTRFEHYLNCIDALYDMCEDFSITTESIHAAKVETLHRLVEDVGVSNGEIAQLLVYIAGLPRG